MSPQVYCFLSTKRWAIPFVYTCCSDIIIRVPLLHFLKVSCLTNKCIWKLKRSMYLIDLASNPSKLEVKSWSLRDNTQVKYLLWICPTWVWSLVHSWSLHPTQPYTWSPGIKPGVNSKYHLVWSLKSQKREQTHFYHLNPQYSITKGICLLSFS